MSVDWTKYDLKKAREIGKEFAKNYLASAAFNIANLDLVDKGILLNSLKASPRSKGGFLDRIQLTYEYYGFFHEVGVDNAFGKGVVIPKTQWRTMAIEDNIDQLSSDMSMYYAELIIDELKIDDVKA